MKFANVASLLSPSQTTSVLLTNLPASVHETNLKLALKDIKCRKIEIEPGCSLHFLRESEAETCGQILTNKLQLKVENCIFGGIS